MSLGFARMRLVDEIVKQNWQVNPTEKNFNYRELLYVIQEMMESEGKRYFENETPRAGHARFREFVKMILYRNLANYDSMLLLSGEKGTGKSSVALVIAREWCRMLGIRFDPKKYLAYNNNEVIEKINDLPKFSPIICLSGDSRINIQEVDGSKHIKYISSLVGRKDFKILSYNKQHRTYEYKSHDGCVCNGKQELYDIILENGEHLTATSGHLILLSDGSFKRLSEISVGDDIQYYHNESAE